tara:strand:- start:2210 stop:2782 length:573 start_codon:yes stop_codon:yes gene_type:complete
MRKLITTIAFAATLPMMAPAAYAESALTPFMTEGVTVVEAAQAAMNSETPLSLEAALDAAIVEGATLEELLKIALSVASPSDGDPNGHISAVAAVTAALGRANSTTTGAQIIAAADLVGISAADAAQGVTQGAATAANGTDQGPQDNDAANAANPTDPLINSDSSNPNAIDGGVNLPPNAGQPGTEASPT